MTTPRPRWHWKTPYPEALEAMPQEELDKEWEALRFKKVMPNDSYLKKEAMFALNQERSERATRRRVGDKPLCMLCGCRISWAELCEWCAEGNDYFGYELNSYAQDLKDRS